MSVTSSRPAMHDPDSSAEALLERACNLPEPRRTALIDQVVIDHLPIARSLAWRYRDKGENLDDLVQVAYLGVVKAARAYRPSHGHSFAAYAVPTVTGELRRHFRDKGWDVRPPRRLQELRARMRAVEEELSHELQHAPSEAELAERLGVTAEEVESARSASAGYSAVSLDAPAGGDSTRPSLRDTLPAQEPDDDSERVLDALALRPLLAALPERDQLILAMRFFRGCTQQQIADEIGVTQMQVSRLLSQALDRLRRGLEDGG